jgi:type III pantothenate kinase
MPAAAPRLPLVAVDVGNTRIKLGLFREISPHSLSEPATTLEVPSLEGDLGAITPWLQPLSAGDARWSIGSVNRTALARLLNWLRASAPHVTPHLLTAGDLPLRIAVERPDRVGIDRLLAAVGANALRASHRAAIVVDLGTAIKVDRVSAEGAFEGGAIMPGIGMAAQALHAATDLLPLLSMAALGEPPPALGRNTEAAMQAGLFWGAVGGIRELIGRMAKVDSEPPQIFLSGGAAPAVAGLLASDARFVPHLTLGGIALATRE